MATCKGAYSVTAFSAPSVACNTTFLYAMKERKLQLGTQSLKEGNCKILANRSSNKSSTFI
jgi:hypothetical protein